MKRKRLDTPTRLFLIFFLSALTACGVATIAIFGDTGSRFEGQPVEAHQDGTPAASDCSAWQLTWIVLPAATPLTGTSLLADAQAVVRDRLDDLERYQGDYVLDASSLLNPPPASNDPPVIVVELFVKAEWDTDERLDAYEQILAMPGVVAGVDPLERDLAPGDILRTGTDAPPGIAATPGPAHPIVLDGDDVRAAFPDVDDDGRYTVTIRLVEQAIPTMTAYLGDRPSRPLAVLLDQAVIAVAEVDAASLEAGLIVIPALDDDQADAWTIVLRSGQHEALLFEVPREPVFTDLCG